MSASSAVQGDPTAFVVPVQDLHIGKRTVDGTDNGAVAVAAMERLAARLYRAGGVSERTFVTVGGDFYHVDNVHKQTTKGTPQDMAMSVPEMVVEGQRVAVELVELLRRVSGSVELVYVPGNHDQAFSLWLYHYLRATYQHEPDVLIGVDTRPRQYRVFGSTLMQFAHGDGAKMANLGLIAAQEAREAWGQTSRTVSFSGHRHTELSRDFSGVVAYQTPTTSGTDAWHEASGYVGNRKALQGHVVDPEEGVVNTATATA